MVVMAKQVDNLTQRSVAELLLAVAERHGTFLPADETAILSIRSQVRAVTAEADIVRQGERPDVAVFVLKGMLARYHTLANGERQYLSFHIRGDLPDVQSLFLNVLDHSLCALDQAQIAVLPHHQLRDLFLRRPGVAFAFWRLTLVDAAIFRQAITNVSARSHEGRLAHLFCEQYCRAEEAQLTEDSACSLPLSQGQLGHALGMSLVSVNRAMQKLRRRRVAEHRAGRLQVFYWPALRRIAGFDPTYLHLDKSADISRMPFSRRG